MNALAESAAKSNFCPFSRQVFVWPYAIDGNPAGTASNFNRDDGGNAGSACRCLVGGCMMWRWTDQPVDQTGARELPHGEKPPGEGWAITYSGVDEPDDPGGEPYRWATWNRKVVKEGRGYCGLAGKP